MRVTRTKNSMNLILLFYGNISSSLYNTDQTFITRLQNLYQVQQAKLKYFQRITQSFQVSKNLYFTRVS